jgi:hypothetical protein
MVKKLNKQSPARSRKSKPGTRKFKPRGFFKREGELLSIINVAPFVIGIVLALIFLFTR